MRQYMLSIIYPAGAQPPAPDRLSEIMRDVSALNRDMQAAGAWVFAAGLQPSSTATMVRVERDQVLTTDGPFAETKEQIGGFSIINAADLDAALAWAARLARAVTVPVEVRPIQQHGRPDA